MSGFLSSEAERPVPVGSQETLQDVEWWSVSAITESALDTA